MPKVSVVIPTYNRRSFLRDAVKSVLSQTYKDYEVIVIDDGSTDDTKDTLESYFGNIHYIFQENQGPGAARNRGIKEACGDYIAWLDSDDMFLPEKLQLQMGCFASSPNVGLVYSDSYNVDPYGGIKNRYKSKVYQPQAHAREQLLRRNFIRTSTVVMKRECLDRVGGFNEEYPYAQDWDLWLRTLSVYPFGGVRKPLVKYRLHPSNRTKRNKKQYREMIRNKAKRLFEIEPERWKRT